jgi:hypothetical protein
VTLKDVLSETWLSKQIHFDDVRQVAGIRANVHSSRGVEGGGRLPSSWVTTGTVPTTLDGPVAKISSYVSKTVK